MREAGCVVRVFFLFSLAFDITCVRLRGSCSLYFYAFSFFLFSFLDKLQILLLFFFFFFANYFILAMTTPRIFLNVFFIKYKLYNLIKREIYILTTTIIKKARKYIRFIIVFYEFSYFEIVA